MASKMVADRLKLRKVVVGAVSANASKVSNGLGTRLSPLLREGETLPDLVLFQDLLVRLVLQQEEELITKDDANLLELVDVDPRERRDALAAELYAEVGSLRDAAIARFGAEGGRKVLGLTGDTARDPELLLRQANQAIRRIRSGAVPQPEERAEGVTVDLQSWPDRVEAKVAALRQVLQEIENERWLGINTVSEKSGALAGFDSTLGSVSLLFRGMFELTGLEAPAERFFPRRILRRSRRSSEDTPEVLPETSGAASETSAGALAAPPDTPSVDGPPVTPSANES